MSDDTHDLARFHGWVNWNPDPLIHAYGTTKRRVSGDLVLALCRVVVREPLPEEFDPTAAKACPDCAVFVTVGLGWDDVKDRRRPLGVDAIVCRRP